MMNENKKNTIFRKIKPSSTNISKVYIVEFSLLK